MWDASGRAGGRWDTIGGIAGRRAGPYHTILSLSRCKQYSSDLCWCFILPAGGIGETTNVGLNVLVGIGSALDKMKQPWPSQVGLNTDEWNLLNQWLKAGSRSPWSGKPPVARRPQGTGGWWCWWNGNMEIAHHGVTSMFIMLGIVCMNISIVKLYIMWKHNKCRNEQSNTIKTHISKQEINFNKMLYVQHVFFLCGKHAVYLRNLRIS